MLCRGQVDTNNWPQQILYLVYVCAFRGMQGVAVVVGGLKRVKKFGVCFWCGTFRS